jgi:hypothetical protein
MSYKTLTPLNYDDWKHCITKECGIPLTSEFIEKRIASFEDHNNDYTKKFIEKYGEDYARQVVAWFVLARHELENK